MQWSACGSTEPTGEPVRERPVSVARDTPDKRRIYPKMLNVSQVGVKVAHGLALFTTSFCLCYDERISNRALRVGHVPADGSGIATVARSYDSECVV